jgi:hypothetical protein
MMKETSSSMQHFVHLKQATLMPKCLQSHVWWPWKKQGPQGCFAFFIPWSKIKVLQKWEKTLEKNKGIEKNEYEKNE